MNKLAEQIKQGVGLREAMEYYGVAFNRRGFAICPFHTEKTASLSIKRNRYMCFGCGASGGVIDFVMQYFGITFGQALVRLNNDFNLGLSAKPLSYRQKREAAVEQKIMRALADQKRKFKKSYDFWTDVYRELFQISILAKSLGESKTVALCEKWLPEIEKWLDENLIRL